MTSPTIPDIWEAFLQAEDKLVLKIQTPEAVEQIKAALSTYKSRALLRDESLAGSLGKFQFDFHTQRKGGKYYLSVGMKRSKAKARLDIEIVSDDQVSSLELGDRDAD